MPPSTMFSANLLLYVIATSVPFGRRIQSVPVFDEAPNSECGSMVLSAPENDT
jgi:hypothetical protein